MLAPQQPRRRPITRKDYSQGQGQRVCARRRVIYFLSSLSAAAALIRLGPLARAQFAYFFQTLTKKMARPRVYCWSSESLSSLDEKTIRKQALVTKLKIILIFDQPRCRLAIGPRELEFPYRVRG